MWYCTMCDYHFDGIRKAGCSMSCPKCKNAKNVVGTEHPFARRKK